MINTLGGPSICKTSAIHPNMSLGLYQNVKGDSVNLFPIMPLSYDLLGNLSWPNTCSPNVTCTELRVMRYK